MINNVNEYLNIIKDDSLHYRLREPATDDIWLDLIKYHENLHLFIALNKSLSSEVLFYLAKSKDENVRWQVACKRKLNYETFYLLSRDDDPSIRERIALNPKTPSSILEFLANDIFSYPEISDESIADLDNESIAEIARRRLNENQ